MRFRVLLLLLVVGCQSLENRLVYHPMPADPRHAAPLPAPVDDLRLRTADGTYLHARWWPHPDAKGTLLYLHGNAGNLEHFGRTVRDLNISLERSILIIDYPGYGRSEGKPSEAGCYAAAQTAYDWLTQTKGIPAQQIVIAGESLGGGIAVELASKRPHEALVLIRTFTSVPEIAKHVSGIASAPAVMVNRFDSLKRIPSCPAPIFIAQAEKDRVMPFDHGEKLRDASTAPVCFHVMRGLDHNDPLPPEFFRELREFLERSSTDHVTPVK